MNFIKKNIKTNINNIPREVPIIIIVYSVTYILLIHTRTHTRNACARAHDLIKRQYQSLHNIIYLTLTKLANKPNISKNKDKNLLFRSKGAGLARLVDGLLIPLQRRGPCSDRKHAKSLQGHVRYGGSSSRFARLTAKRTSVT